MGSVIAEIPNRQSPFIILHGTALHLIVEREVFLRPATSTDALLALMACYYIFDMSYSDQVLSTLLYLQATCLQRPDDLTKKNGPVNVFSKLVEKEQREAAQSQCD